MNPPAPQTRLVARCLFSTTALVAAIASARAADAAAPTSGAYSEKLELVSDASVADSLARQKNLNFSSVRIDGETTGISLSSLAADQIQKAMATKVPTSDLDADAVGGLLQLTSRRAFDQKERTLRGSIAVSYDPLVGKPDPDASITYGRSFGAQKRFGFLATLEHERGRDRDEEIELDWDPNTAQLDKFQIGEVDETTVETNFNGTLDWKLGEKSLIYLRLEAQVTSARERSRRLGYDLPALPAVVPATGAALRGSLQRSLEEGRQRGSALTLAAGASHHGETWLLDLRLNHRAGRNRTPDERNYEFLEDDVEFVYRRTEPSFPTATSGTGSTPGEPTRQRLEELQIHREHERSADAVASFDVTRRWRDVTSPGWLKSGVKARNRRTTRDERHDIYEPTGPGLRVSDAAGGAASRLLAGRYSLDGYPDFDALRRVFATQPARFALDEAKTRNDTDPANFDVRQQILAGYAMASFSAGANRFVAGARAERTASRFIGHEVAFDEDGRYESARPVAARNSVTHFFPGIHVSRPLSKIITVFASWTRSIRRPDYTDLVPARRISRADREIEEGNADLRATLYTNYDAAFDYAYRKDGQVSLELFHRDIRDPILTRVALLTGGPFAGYERERPENGGRARLQGLQLTWQQELAVLSRRLDGVELEINYTHQRSRQSVENRPRETLPLTERPTHKLTVQLSYDCDPYYVSVGFEQISRTLDSIGRRSSEDRVTPSLNNWDLSISRQMRKGLRVFLDVENVTARPERRYTGDAPLIHTRRGLGYVLDAASGGADAP